MRAAEVTEVTRVTDVAHLGELRCEPRRQLGRLQLLPRPWDSGSAVVAGRESVDSQPRSNGSNRSNGREVSRDTSSRLSLSLAVEARRLGGCVWTACV